MSKVSKSIRIHAPIGNVFGYIAKPESLPQIWPSMVEIKNVKLNTVGGSDFDWVYKMAGIKFDGSSVTTEFTKDKHIVTESKKGIQSRFEWIFSTEREYTTLDLTIEYTIPSPLLSKLADSFITKTNEREADDLLVNLKTLMEG
jgi:uncharacterized membrane protein